MDSIEFAMRFTGVRKSGIYEGQHDRYKPEKVVVRKQREQAEQGDQVEQNLLRLVRHSFRKRVDRKENHTRQNDACDDEPQRNVEEHVGFAWRRDKEWHMRCRYRIR